MLFLGLSRVNMIASEIYRACIVIVEINSKSCSGRQSWTRLGEAQGRVHMDRCGIYAFTIELDNVMTIKDQKNTSNACSDNSPFAM